MEEPSRNQPSCNQPSLNQSSLNPPSINQPSLNPTTSHPTFLSQDMFIDTEPSPKPEDLSLFSSASTIPPAQRPPATPVYWSLQLQKKKKSPSDHDNDRVTKYAKYFKENKILPIPELVEAVEPKTLPALKKNQSRRCLKLQASQVGTFTEGVLPPGMSCFRPKT